MVKRLLLIKLGAIGDVIMTTTMLEALRQRYPAHKIYYLTSSLTLPLVDGNPNIDEVIVFRPTRKFLEYLKWLSFDVVINLQNRLSMSLLVEYINPREVVGIYGGLEDKIYVTNKATEKLLDMLSLGGQTHQTSFFQIYADIINSINSKSEPFIGSFKKRKHKKVYIGITPGSNWPSKRWGHENFSALIDLLGRHKNYKVFIIGDKTDKLITTQILKKSKNKRVIDLCGKYNLKGLIQIINQMNVVITHDTGPAFIAMALGIPTVQIFGPTNPKWSGNYNGTIIQTKEKCRGCFKYYCHHQTCMKMIKPEDVYKAVRGELT